MKTSKLICAVLVFAASATGAFAGEAPRPPVEQLRKNIERWKSLPPEERERIKKSFRQYKEFQPDRRAAVGENLEKFRKLTPEKRRELTKKLEGLPPQQRERIAHRLRQLHQLGADRRKTAMAFARMAKSLTPEQKRQLEQLATPEEKRKYLGTLFRGHVLNLFLKDKSADERARFQQLPPAEQKQQLQHFFRERVMRGPPGEHGGGK